MARLDQGLLGGYSGKLGTTVGATWKGINVVRTYQPNVANPNTQAQRDHRYKFKEIAQLGSFFLASMVKPFWDKAAKRMSGYNAFVSLNARAMKDSLQFDPMEFIIGNGQMGHPTYEISLLEETHRLDVAWDEDEKVLYGQPTDELYLIAFNYVGEPIGYSLGEVKRKDTLIRIDLIEGADASEAIVCVAWLSENRLNQSITERIALVAK